MVRISDTTGTDLVVSPPAPATLVAAGGTARLTLALFVHELDTDLPVQSLSGTLDWNDGGPVSVFTGSGTLAVQDYRDLGPGDYVFQFHAHNYALPVAHHASINLALKVKPAVVTAVPEPILFGPILPRDQGFPGAQDWLFNNGTDLRILESSLKMLLTTTKGERLMEPDYGTNLRKILFEANVQSVESVVHEEIVNAVSRWEPRVQLQQAVVNRDPNGRQITVVATFTSTVSGRGFELVLQFAP